MSVDAVGVRFTSIVDPTFLGNVNSEFAKIQSEAVKHLTAIGLQGFGSIVTQATANLGQIQKQMTGLKMDSAPYKEAADKAQVLEAALNKIRSGELAEGAKLLGEALKTDIGLIEKAKLETATLNDVAAKLATSFAEAAIKSQGLATASEVSGIKFKALDASVESMVSAMAKADSGLFLGSAGEQAVKLTTNVQYAANAVKQLSAELTASAGRLSALQSGDATAGDPGVNIPIETANIAKLEQQLEVARGKLTEIIGEVTKFKTTTVAAFKEINQQDIIKEGATARTAELNAKLQQLNSAVGTAAGGMQAHADRIKLISEYYAEGGKQTAGYTQQLNNSKQAVQNHLLSIHALALGYTALGESQTRSTVAIKSDSQAQTDAAQKYNTAKNTVINALAEIDASSHQYANTTEQVIAKMTTLTTFFTSMGNKSNYLKGIFASLVVELQRLTQLSGAVGAKEASALQGPDASRYKAAIQAVDQYEKETKDLYASLKLLNQEEKDNGKTLGTLAERYTTLSEYVEKFGARTDRMSGSVAVAKAELQQMLALMAASSLGVTGSSSTDSKVIAADNAAREKQAVSYKNSMDALRQLDAEEKLHGNTLQTLISKLGVLYEYNTKVQHGKKSMVAIQKQLTSELFAYVASLDKVLSASTRVQAKNQAEITAYTNIANAQKLAYTNLKVLDAEYRVHGDLSQNVASKLQVLTEYFNKFGYTSKVLNVEFANLSRQFTAVAASGNTFSQALARVNLTASTSATAQYTKETQQLAASMAQVDAQSRISGNTKQANLTKIQLLTDYTRKWGMANREVVAELTRLKAVSSPVLNSILQSMKSIVLMQLKYTIGFRAIYGTMAAFGTGLGSIIKYEQQLQNIQSITRATEPEIKRISEAIREQGRTTKFSAIEIADAMTVLGQAGFSAAESVEAVKGVTALATATMSDMGSTVDLVTTAIRAFGLETSQTAEVVNLLAAATNESKLTIDKIRTAFNYIASTGHIVGLSIGDVTTAMGLMANAGIRASTIGTGLRYSITSLVEPSTKLITALRGIGVTIDQVDPRTRDFGEILMTLQAAGFGAGAAFEAFGKRGGNAISALVNSAHEFAGFKDSIEGTNRAFEMMAEQMMPVENSWKNLKDLLIDVSLDIGSGLLPVLHKLMYVLETLVGIVKLFSSGVFDADQGLGDLAIRTTTLAAVTMGLVVAYERFIQVRLLGFLASAIGYVEALSAALIAGTTILGKLRLAWLVTFGGAATSLGGITIAIGAVVAALYAVTHAQQAWENSKTEGLKRDVETNKLRLEFAKSEATSINNLAKALDKAGSDDEKRYKVLEKYVALVGEHNELLAEAGDTALVAAEKQAKLTEELRKTADARADSAVLASTAYLVSNAALYERMMQKKITLLKEEERLNKLLAEGQTYELRGSFLLGRYNVQLIEELNDTKKALNELDFQEVTDGVTAAANSLVLYGGKVSELPASLNQYTEFMKLFTKQVTAAGDAQVEVSKRKVFSDFVYESVKDIAKLGGALAKPIDPLLLYGELDKLLDIVDPKMKEIIKSLEIDPARAAELTNSWNDMWSALVQSSRAGEMDEPALTAEFYKLRKKMYEDVAALADEATANEVARINREYDEKARGVEYLKILAEDEYKNALDYRHEIDRLDREKEDIDLSRAHALYELQLKHIAAITPYYTGNAKALLASLKADADAAIDAAIIKSDQLRVDRERTYARNVVLLQAEADYAKDLAGSFISAFNGPDVLQSFDDFIKLAPSAVQKAIEAMQLSEDEKKDIAATWLVDWDAVAANMRAGSGTLAFGITEILPFVEKFFGTLRGLQDADTANTLKNINLKYDAEELYRAKQRVDADSLFKDSVEYRRALDDLSDESAQAELSRAAEIHRVQIKAYEGLKPYYAESAKPVLDALIAEADIAYDNAKVAYNQFIQERTQQQAENRRVLQVDQAYATEVSKKFMEAFNAKKALGSFDEFIGMLPEKVSEAINAIALPDTEKAKLTATWSLDWGKLIQGFRDGSGAYGNATSDFLPFVDKFLAQMNQKYSDYTTQRINDATRESTATTDKLNLAKKNLQLELSLGEQNIEEATKNKQKIIAIDYQLAEEQWSLAKKTHARKLALIQLEYATASEERQRALTDEEASVNTEYNTAKVDYAAATNQAIIDNEIETRDSFIDINETKFAVVTAFHAAHLRGIEKRYADQEHALQASLARSSTTEAQYFVSSSKMIFDRADALSAAQKAYAEEVTALSAGLKAATDKDSIVVQEEIYKKALGVAEDHYDKMIKNVNDLKKAELDAIKAVQTAKIASFNAESAYIEAVKALNKQAGGDIDALAGNVNLQEIYKLFTGYRKTDGTYVEPSLITDMKEVKRLREIGDLDGAEQLLSRANAQLAKSGEGIVEGSAEAKIYASALHDYGLALTAFFMAEDSGMGTLRESIKRGAQDIHDYTKPAIEMMQNAMGSFYVLDGVEGEADGTTFLDALAKGLENFPERIKGLSTRGADAVRGLLEEVWHPAKRAAEEALDLLEGVERSAISKRKAAEGSSEGAASTVDTLTLGIAGLKTKLDGLRLPDELSTGIAELSRTTAELPAAVAGNVTAAVDSVRPGIEQMQSLLGTMNFDAMGQSARTNIDNTKQAFQGLKENLEAGVVAKIVLDLKTELGDWAADIKSSFDSTGIIEAVNLVTAAVKSMDNSMTTTLVTKLGGKFKDAIG